MTTPIWDEIVHEYKRKGVLPELSMPPTLTDAIKVMPREVVAKAFIVIFDGYLVKDRFGDTTVVPGAGAGRARAYGPKGVLIYDEAIHS